MTDGTLEGRLEALRADMASAAQAVVDEWEQDEDGWDEEFGSGGACDRVSEALAEVVARLDGVEIVDGGHDGDDHAWLIVYDHAEAYAVDVPPGVYEEGGGYSWRKIDGARIGPEDVAIWRVDRAHVAVFRRSSARDGMDSKPVDLAGAAARVASHSVEARRRSRSKRGKKPKARGKTRARPKRDPAETAVRTSQPSFGDDMLRLTTEYSCRMDLSISADFEGQIPKDKLIRKLKAEMTAAVKAAMGIVARDFGLESTGVRVQPVRVECAMNDQ